MGLERRDMTARERELLATIQATQKELATELDNYKAYSQVWNTAESMAREARREELKRTRDKLLKALIEEGLLALVAEETARVEQLEALKRRRDALPKEAIEEALVALIKKEIMK